ncbi:MAG: hypothetical protein ABI867_24285 [Kofleriaceae bacterium]
MRSSLLLIALAIAIPHPADAAPCTDLPNPVYLQVGDTQVNLMKRLARALRDNTANPISLVWFASGSCTNIQAIYTRVPVTANMEFVASTLENPSWTPTSAATTCTPTGGVVPDVANSALFVSSCTTETPPATVKSSFGPVQAYVMAVPEASTQTAITYEEAYFVFGFGAAGMIAPWVGPELANLFVRTTTKSTLLTWAANIDVMAGKWKGMAFDKSGEVVAALQTSTTPESSIGLLGAEVYDSLRANLNSLAFRAKGQYAAYYADSTRESRDKKNLRDGHYTVWSPTEWLLTTDTSGVAVSASAKYVVDLIAGRSVTPKQNFDMASIVAAVGLVPDCAMNVKRSFDGGPLSLYQPAESCQCKYESLVDASSCQTCSTNVACGSGVCRDSFCEVQ